MRKVLIACLVLCCAAANATVVLTASGTSAAGVDVAFEARLTLSGDVLAVELVNNSPVDSLYPDDVLGSFYFDIVNNSGERPAMVYESAVGDACKGVKNGADILIEAGADLRAGYIAGGWQFRDDLDTMQVPMLGFGLGTVGNSQLSPNGFNGNLVSPVDYGIYTGEITTQPLTNPDALVKETATFTFSGLTGFTEADISRSFAFGLGTAPDSLLVPEPATMVLWGLGALVFRRRK